MSAIRGMGAPEELASVAGIVKPLGHIAQCAQRAGEQAICSSIPATSPAPPAHNISQAFSVFRVAYTGRQKQPVSGSMRKESKMMMLRGYPATTGAVYRGGVGLLLSCGVATVGLALERWHTLRYGLTPANLSLWIPSLLAFLLGVALTGASVGGWWYRHRGRTRLGATTRRRLDAALLIVGALLLLVNAPAVLDLTLTAPTSATGKVDAIGFSISPFDLVKQYNLTVNGRSYTVAHDVYTSDGGQCVTVVYGPRSQIAFTVTLVPFSDLSAQRQFCGEPTSATRYGSSISSISSIEMRPYVRAQRTARAPRASCAAC